MVAWTMSLTTVVPDRRELQYAAVESGLFGYLPHHAFRRRLIDVGPTPGEGPATVTALADHQNPALDEGRTADIHFRRWVPLLLAEEAENGLGIFVRALGHDGGGKFAHALVALPVIGILGKRQSGLRYGLQLAR
jgi:hypothetical protein